MAEAPNPLLSAPLSVINLGAELFAEALRQQEVPVVQVQWTPPAAQDDDLLDLLDTLL
ncbi:hypothetical protein [Oceanicola sp. S124]|uniref:hypothetical protein n=1 Tax=Oceanicola sp. S124 TaxID=1042378 RepID=UPI0002558123|nr:hypothetical protein [Oceanicola sp. S124]